MTQDPLTSPLNPIQRFWLTRMLPRYRKLDAETLGLIVERDRFLLSVKALGMWVGLFCGIVGTSFGLASAGLAPWIAVLSAVLVFAAFVKAGVRAWVQPQQFSGKRLWRVALFAMLATYAGALTSFGSKLGALIDSGVPWYEAALRVAWYATPLQIIVLIGALIMLAGIATARREYLQRALDQSRAEQARDAAAAQLTQARLSLLQAQIQPHFLFNTLAALQHWVDVGDARAAPLLRSLTAFLRGSTEMMLRDGVTLAQECAMVRHYLAIMQSRLGDRLRFGIDVVAECETQQLPPGLLITLVENAVEHGIEPLLRGGELQVIARVAEGGMFELRVLDDGAGLAPNALEGVGLANSRERLRHQFGARAELRIGARAEGAGTEVRLCIQPDSGGSQTG
jgi:signal transduction histidine kinase